MSKISIRLAFGVLALLATLAMAQAQDDQPAKPLGDIARGQRKQPTTEKKVYTDADVASPKDPEPPPPPPPAQSPHTTLVPDDDTQQPEAASTPAAPEKSPVAEKKPAPEKKPVAEVKPAPEKKPVAEVKPAPEKKPVAEAKPALEKKPVAEVKPAPEKKPVAAVKPVPEKKPVAEVKPAPEKKPVAEVKPAPEKKPVAEVKPAPEKKPVAELKPVPEKKPVAEVKPAAAEKPVARLQRSVYDRPKDKVEEAESDFIVVPAGTEIRVDITESKVIVPVRVGFATPIPPLSKVAVQINRAYYYTGSNGTFGNGPVALAENAVLTTVTVDGVTYPVQAASVPLDNVGATRGATLPPSLHDVTFILSAPISVHR